MYKRYFVAGIYKLLVSLKPKRTLKNQCLETTKQKIINDEANRWELVIRKQADFFYTKELKPDDLFEIRINSGQVTEKTVTVTLRKLIDIIEDVRTT